MLVSYKAASPRQCTRAHGTGKAVPTRPHGSPRVASNANQTTKPKKSSATAAVQKNTERAALHKSKNVPRRADQSPSQRPSNNDKPQQQRLDHPRQTRPHAQRREAEPSAPQLTSKHKHNLNHTTNQELPEALYGRNLLALRHDASGVRLAFDALRVHRPFKMGRVDGVSRRWRKRGGGVLGGSKYYHALERRRAPRAEHFR